MPHSDFLELTFGGCFSCRLATDPDPTRETRGVSGYTYALEGEPDLDAIIKLQEDQLCDGERRRANHNPFHKVGVTVTEAKLSNGDDASMLVGAKVCLLNEPRYVMRNQIVSDGVERIAPPIIPFNLRIEGDGVVLQRADPLDLEDPHKPVWKMSPGSYERRLPNYFHPSDVAMNAIGVDSDSGARAYFLKRKEWLQMELIREQDPIQQANLETRLFAIESFSNSDPDPSASPGLIESRLTLQALWHHSIRGAHIIAEGLAPLGGSVPCGDGPEDYWHIRYWHGGWDGDLMRGWMAGTLKVPFVPDSD